MADSRERTVTSGSPTGARRRLGLALRRLRDDAGITGEEAASAVDRSASWISRIESGRSGLRARELRDLLDLYELPDESQRAELENLAERGRRRAWWSQYADQLPAAFLRYIGLEAESTSIELFQDIVIPGLLQTDEYMKAIIDRAVIPVSENEAERVIAVRRQRQKLITEPDGPTFTAIIEESILRRAYGGATVLRNQLVHLLQEAERPSVELHILALTEAARALPAHGFTILHFADDPPVGFVETIGGGIVEEGPSVPETYGIVWENLLRASLDREQSRSFIDRVVHDLT
jgi:transcriptional regulator with XRE-family HTH domain